MLVLRGVYMTLCQDIQVRRDAEAELKSRIAFWVHENIRHGGSGKPDVTYRIIVNEEPELFEAVGRTRVFQLCREIHAFEDVEESMHYTALFDTFNEKYFRGSLPKYRVRLVADIFSFIESHDDLLLNLIDLGAENVNLADSFTPYYYSADGLLPSRIDLLGREIILSTHEDGMHDKECQLLHHMARAATDTVSDRDVRWQAEMKRLRGHGAPVGDKYLDLTLRTGEYVG
jgi:hypothetical protein